ncbi:P27 family phage terminase small subunit [Paraliobacillus zengyii]|uniref:P27 family phage terminase small subunit n=1 Tax=Paraliobacillus zengyii TaxID=2213194 RepID=UPI000DD49C3A|nr:P27 family phage terminase small subunit [Paraliobacillus zengyii]
MTVTFRTDVSTHKIKDYLLSRVDTDSPVEVEKVGRYLKHIEIYRRMERTIKKEGVSITVKNGSQTYVKSHPLLTEMNKVNTSIMNIERTFNFIDNDETNNKTYTANDLI